MSSHLPLSVETIQAKDEAVEDDLRIESLRPLEPSVPDEPIQLSPYDPSWPNRFEEERMALYYERNGLLPEAERVSCKRRFTPERKLPEVDALIERAQAMRLAAHRQRL